VSDGAPPLDNQGLFVAADPHGARGVLATFPAQCRDAVGIETSLLPPLKRPRAIVVAGMGGSAAAGDLLAACAADRVEVPVVVHRGYGLPSIAWDDTLVFAVSYSGNTVEVLSAVDAARARRLQVVVIAAGGTLGELAGARMLPWARVPQGLMPRMALGYLFFPMVSVLRALDLEVTATADVDEAVAVLDILARELGVERPAAENEAKRLAAAVGRRWPAVYGGPLTGTVAYRWKTDIEENAKSFALAGALPEMNHNTIEAWRAPIARELQLVLLRDAGEAAEIRERFEVLEDLVSGVAGGVSSCWSRGHGVIARMLSLIYLGQWTSYYLAILRAVDPWTVPQLEEIKRRLSER
jgi:glucose/mannose-6-phosphate isomerase